MHFLIILAILAALAGCQLDTLKTELGPVPVGPANAIARDMADRFAEITGAERGTIVVNNWSSPAGASFAAALKERGYAVTTDQNREHDKTAVEVAFALEVGDDQTLAMLSTKAVRLARAYKTTATTALPLSPLSVMQR